MSHVGACAGASSSGMKVFNLERTEELRIEVSKDAPLCLRLLSGKAEIFGNKLSQGVWVTFPPGLNFAVFAWDESTIEMDISAAKPAVYRTREPAMRRYMNVHIALESRRITALNGFCQGPRVVVVGPTDSGKTTLSRMLLNWATGWATSRPVSWRPTFVDLDVSQGSITIPGCIAATPFEKPIDLVEGFRPQTSLAYFYGHVNPSDNEDLYKVLVNELAGTLEGQFAENYEYRAAGMVVNTMGWTEGVGFDLLLHAIRTLKANIVLVLDQEKLRSFASRSSGG